MKISGQTTDSTREKYMSWPLVYDIPGVTPLPPTDQYPTPTIPSIRLVRQDSIVVAVCRFDVAATEVNARGFTEQLRKDIIADGLRNTAGVDMGEVIVGQYDALFSLNKRRNEVWVELEDHPWK